MLILVTSTYIFHSFALYGLIVFYGLTKEELAGKRPLAKFLAIKLIVMATFYQSFVVSLSVSINRLLLTFLVVQCIRRASHSW